MIEDASQDDVQSAREQSLMGTIVNECAIMSLTGHIYLRC
jgi:hypothetical protein